MRIKLGKEIKPTAKIEYINNITINFKYNNLEAELNKKLKDIVSNVRLLNKDNDVNIKINSSNSLSSHDLEIDYSIELRPYQYPTKHLNDFYTNFSKFLIDYKKGYELLSLEKDAPKKEDDALSNLVSRLDAIEENNIKQSNLRKSR